MFERKSLAPVYLQCSVLLQANIQSLTFVCFPFAKELKAEIAKIVAEVEAKAVQPKKSEKECQTDEPEGKVVNQVKFIVQHATLKLVQDIFFCVSYKPLAMTFNSDESRILLLRPPN